MDHHSLEEQGLVFHHNDHHSYSCTYYVQSPSTLSHANSAADIRHMITAAAAATNDSSAFQSPARTETLINPEGSTTLSSHGSNAGGHYFLHAKKISYDARSHDTEDTLAEKNRLIIVNASHHRDHGDDDDGGDDDGELYDYYYHKESLGFWKTYFSYSDSDSSVWICLQISWRFLVSLIVALLVFYLASRPPPPKLSLEIGRIWEFGLGEGVDDSGVATKILNLNCSLNLIVDNQSKLFGLHINPPTMDMSFNRLSFGSTHGPKMYAESGRSTFVLWIGTSKKAMYGAGREMEDMLHDDQGMPLTIRLSFTSTFRVVLNLIRPKFHHRAHCLLLLRRAFHNNHKTLFYNSTCTF